MRLVLGCRGGGMLHLQQPDAKQAQDTQLLSPADLDPPQDHDGQPHVEQVKYDIGRLLGILGISAHGNAECVGAQVHTPKVEDERGNYIPHGADDDVGYQSETDEATRVEAVEHQGHANLDYARDYVADVGHGKFILSVDVRYSIRERLDKGCCRLHQP